MLEFFERDAVVMGSETWVLFSRLQEVASGAETVDAAAAVALEVEEAEEEFGDEDEELDEDEDEGAGVGIEDLTLLEFKKAFDGVDVVVVEVAVITEIAERGFVDSILDGGDSIKSFISLSLLIVWALVAVALALTVTSSTTDVVSLLLLSIRAFDLAFKR